MGYMNDLNEKILPFSKDAEDAVVGACIYEPECIGSVNTIVKPHHFFSTNLAYIYDEILKMELEGVHISTMLVYERIKHNTKGISGDYILELSERVPTIKDIEEYARIVVNDSIRRTAIKHAQDMTQLVRETNDVPATITEHIQKLENISHSGISDPVKGFKQLIEETNTYLEQKQSGELVDDTIPTGLTDLDKLLNGGLRLSHFDILAARPAMGKTSLAVQIILHNIMKRNTNCLFFSIEMPEVLITLKAYSNAGRINYKELDAVRQGTKLDWGRVWEVAGKLTSKGEMFIDAETKDLNNMISLIRKYVRNYEVKFVVIDYLQLMSIPGKFGTRDQEIGHCVNELAYLAKILNINILCLSQLNRGVESRESKVPMLSDLRESGNIEQSAWRVLAIHREEYYDNQTESKGLADIHVLKGKISNVGKISVHYDKTCTRFDDLEWRRPNY